MIRIKWHGHSCFEIQGEDAPIITDPHDGVSLGLPVPIAEPDIITISHQHEDHANGKKLLKKNQMSPF